MRTIRMALSCAASALALVALSAGAVAAGEPGQDSTISLGGITLGSDDGHDLEAEAGVELEVDLSLDPAREDDLAADVQAAVDVAVGRTGGDAVAAADGDASIHLGIGGTRADAPTTLDTEADVHADLAVGALTPSHDAAEVDADIDADAAATIAGTRRDGITALVRVPALLDVSVIELIDAGAVADLCVGLGIWAEAPACSTPAGGDAPPVTDGDGVAALVDAATGVGAVAGDVAAVGVLADACVGIGIGTRAPTCGSEAMPDGDRAPDGAGDGGPGGTPTDPAGAPGPEGVAPDEDVTVRGGSRAAPDSTASLADASAPRGELPDTAVGAPGDLVLWGLIGAVLAGLAVGGRRRPRSSVR